MKPIHSNDKYRHNILQCRNRFRKGEQCHNRHFKEKQIGKIMNAIFRQAVQKYLHKTVCCEVLNKVVGNRPEARRYIMGIAIKGTVVDEGDWALLVDKVDVYRGRLEVSLFGGEKMRVRV